MTMVKVRGPWVRPRQRDDEAGFGPLPFRRPNFAACPKGGQCTMKQRPGSGPPRCSKCGRTA